MAFFLNNQPTEPDGLEPNAPDADDTSNAASHSARIRPLFKQDPGLPDSLSGQHISLSAYISKHLQDTEQSTAPPEPPPAPSGFQFITGPLAQKQNQEPVVQGQYLNSLDVELAAGLEQYLPTPLFRLRVMKKRLDGDIAELRMRLNKYERLPEQSPELRGRMDAVRSRLETLEAHERQVSQELANALAFGPLLYQLSKRTQGAENWAGAWFGWFRRQLTRLLYGNAFLHVEAAGQELRELQELFADRLKDKTASSAEISQILNRYEQTAHDMETLAQQLKPQSLSARLWQEARRLVK